MWNTFKYTLLSLIKDKNILIWPLAFPLILSTLFSVMFADLDSSFVFKPIPTAIVENAGFDDAPAFKELVEALSRPGDGQVLDAHPVPDISEAERLMQDDEAMGYLSVDAGGTPSLSLTASTKIDETTTFYQTILKDIVNSYLRSEATVETLAAENPAALADPATIQALYSPASYTNETAVLANTASGSVRYFYALLGFASIMAAAIGMTAITRTQANLSPLGARRALGGTSRTKTLAATLLASWLLSFLCLLLAFCYIRFVLGIGFGGRDLDCILGIAVASLMTTALGAFIGSIPKLGEGAKSGILTGLSCVLALFAGLYGVPSQNLADSLAKNAPLVQAINPSKQVTDLFNSLYFYSSLDPFASAIAILLAMAAVLFLLSAVLMRRQRYASL